MRNDVANYVFRQLSACWIQTGLDGTPQQWWSRHGEALCREVVGHARVPSYGSARAIRDMARNPLRIPHYTREDGVQDMTPGEIRRIILRWIERLGHANNGGQTGQGGVDGEKA